MKTLVYTESARQEIREAYAYLADERIDLGGQFIEELDAAERIIIEHPRTAHFMGDGPFRMRRFKRLTYGLVYLETEEDIRVHAVMHLHRRPGYWRGRS